MDENEYNSITGNQDYYYVLNVSPSASLEEIKSSFRELAKKNHPDKQNDQQLKKLAHEKFILVSKAFKTLMDPICREQYDAYKVKEDNIEKKQWYKRLVFNGTVDLSEMTKGIYDGFEQYSFECRCLGLYKFPVIWLEDESLKSVIFEQTDQNSEGISVNLPCSGCSHYIRVLLDI